MHSHTSDVVIAGAGIIGLSLALELRRAGASVMVLERGEPGREASWAAAGMLVTSDPDTQPALRPLAEMSAALYQRFVEDLELRSEIKVGFESRGALYVASKEEEFPSDALAASDIKKSEPMLAERDRVYLLEERTVDPRLLVEAAVMAAKRSGIVVHHQAHVASVSLSKEHQLEIATNQGPYSAATFVNCGGAWAAGIVGADAATRPVKGHMLAVIPQGPAPRHVIRSREVYLVPRRDGRVLIGSTLEEAGYDKAVDTKTIQQLHQKGANLIPSIGEAKMIEAWAGLRPGSPDGLPILGAGSIPGTYVATGHFRNGILLAPVTAVAMSELIQGKSPSIDLRSFAPARLTGSEALTG